MKNSVLIIELYDDEDAVALLLDYDKLNPKIKALVDKGLKTDKYVRCNAYEVGLQSIMQPNMPEQIKPNEITTFMGTVYFYCEFDDDFDEEDDTDDNDVFKW